MWKFIISSSDKSNWFNHDGQEVCFIGRSNVGKSSLINALANSKVARTSNTPGRTQLLNYFETSTGRMIVDLPGYGYAKMSKNNKEKMLNMLEQYFVERKNIAAVFLLFDSKIGLTSLDKEMIEYLNQLEHNLILVGTKLDKANQSEMSRVKKDASNYSQNIIFTSSSKKKNLKLLEDLIEKQFNL